MTERARPIAWVTWLIVAANLAMFVVEVALGGSLHPGDVTVVRLGGELGARTLRGEWWRLGSSLFVHLGVLHLAADVLVLAVLARAERVLGHLRFAVVYGVAGVLGAVAAMADAPFAVIAGASGAAFGVIAACAVMLAVRRECRDPGWLLRLAAAAVLGVLVLYLDSTTPGISFAANLTGFATGAVTTLALLAGGRADAQRNWRAGGALAAGLALAITALAIVPAPLETGPVIADFHRVEHACIRIYNDELHATKKQLAAGQPVDETAFADVIDHKVLPPWRALRARLAAIDLRAVPPHVAHLIILMRTYVKDREAAWAALSALKRDPAHGTLQQWGHYHQLERVTRRDVAVLGAELPPYTPP